MMGNNLMEIDEKIIRKAIEKDEHAINLIYENTLNTAYFIAKHYACNQNTVNDILQESYIKVFANLNNLKDSSKLQSWINAIVRNKALDYNRKNEEWTFSDLSEDDGCEWDIADESGAFTPEVNVDYTETRRLMMDIVDSLPVDQRVCIYMRFYDELSVKEIAQELMCNEETVKSRIRYAKKKMKEKVLDLEKNGTKLYVFPFIPCLCWIFQEEAKACVCPRQITGFVEESGRTSVVGHGTKSSVAKQSVMNSSLIKIASIGMAVAMVTGIGGYFGTSAVINKIIDRQRSVTNTPVIEIASENQTEQDGGIIEESEAGIKYEAVPDAIAWKRYADILSNLYYLNEFPDKKETDEWNGMLDIENLESVEYRYRILDVDKDGTDELMIYAFGGYMAAIRDVIYKYDKPTGKVEKMMEFGNEGDLYENGSIISNNHGVQTIYYYDNETHQYCNKGSFYFTEVMDDSEKEKYDLNGNGQVCIDENSEYCDDSEYDEVIKTYVKGSVVESFEGMQKLTYDNVTEISKKASDKILDEYKDIAMQAGDWGILLLQPYDWNFISERNSLTKKLLDIGMSYKMLDGEFGIMDTPYEYGAEYELYNEKNKVARVDLVDGGGIVFYQPIDEVCIYGCRPGDDESKLVDNMKALGLYKVDDGIYYSGDAECNCTVEYKVNKDGVITQLEIRPHCKFAG